MTEKRGVFKSWTLLLAIFTFSLSLLGTFLVRSGVLNSVHAFASDPTRGVFILAFLGIVIGASLVLFALRAPVVKSVTGFSFLSRESFLLANSILFLITANLVLLGTIYPLVSDALNMGKVSVGEPWFNLFFTKIMASVALLLGLGSMLNWKRTDFSKIRWWQLCPFLLACWVGFLSPIAASGEYSKTAAVYITVGAWVILASLADIWRKAGTAENLQLGLKRLSRSYYGMVLAHVGFGACILGVCVNSIYSDKRDVRLTFGKPIEVAGYQYELADVSRQRGANFVADEGEIIVRKDGSEIFRLFPQKRRYMSGGSVMTEAAIDVNLFRDIYVSLGEKLNNTDWAVSIHYKPLVRWIWIGGLFMALGGILAITDKRYKKSKSVSKQRSRSHSRVAAGSRVAK